jgi:hypothetical protein
VAALYSDWFAALEQENPSHAARQLVFLKGLGRQRSVMELLDKHPETAGMLGAANDPGLLARTLEKAGPQDYDLVLGLYAQHADPDDAARLAQALDRHGALICHLIRGGLVGAELPFLFPRTGEAEQEYDLWLAEELQARAGDDDEKRMGFQFFLLDEGRGLRQRLRENTQFRSTFRLELWPKLTRVVGQSGTWAIYVGEPHLWDLLSLPQGEQLLQDEGSLPLRLLFDEGAYASELHELIIRALLEDDRVVLQALVQFRDAPQFTKFLKRSLTREQRRSALVRLLRLGTKDRTELDKFNRLDDGALAEELRAELSGIETWVPLFYTYHVGKKLYQGRDPSAMEWVLAVADPASFLLPALKAGGKGAKMGGKLLAGEVATTLKNQGKEYAIRQFERRAAQTGVRLSPDELAAIGTKLLGKDVEYEVLHYSAVSVLAQVERPFREALRNATTFEATASVRFLFTHSGLSRQTFKRMTGLEARLFMRKDARVYIQLGSTAAGALASRFVNQAYDQFADKAVEDSGAAEQLRAWRRNIGAWWLMNSSGLGDTPAAPKN